jgi:hypothetical protein
LTCQILPLNFLNFFIIILSLFHTHFLFPIHISQILSPILNYPHFPYFSPSPINPPPTLPFLSLFLKITPSPINSISPISNLNPTPNSYISIPHSLYSITQIHPINHSTPISIYSIQIPYHSNHSPPTPNPSFIYSITLSSSHTPPKSTPYLRPITHTPKSSPSTSIYPTLPSNPYTTYSVYHSPTYKPTIIFILNLFNEIVI